MNGEKGVIGGGDRQSWRDFERRTTYDAAIGQAVEARLEEVTNMPKQIPEAIEIDFGDVSFMPVASREQLPSLYAAIEQEYAADMNRMVDIRDPNVTECPKVDWGEDDGIDTSATFGFPTDFTPRDIPEFMPEGLGNVNVELSVRTDMNYGIQPMEWQDEVAPATCLADAAVQDVTAHLAESDCAI